MFFKQIEVGPMQNFTYIIADGNDGAVVDPGWEYERLLEICQANHIRIKKILLTHAHFDHVKDLRRILEKTEARVYVHNLEEFREIDAVFVRDEMIIPLGNLQIKVIHTPGHTPGSVCYLVENKLFTGDTLFVGTIGKTDLPGGNLAHMIESLRKLAKLNPKIEIYPGHDYGLTKSSTIGQEKKTNSFMGM